MLLLGVIDVIDQLTDKEENLYWKVCFYSEMEAPGRAAKFPSCVIGHLIDCELTVIDRDRALIKRPLRSLGLLVLQVGCTVGL